MSDASDIHVTPEFFHVEVIRQDIADPDKAGARLDFVATSGGDMEMTVQWGDPPRDRGTYLIPAEAFAEMFGVAVRMFIDRQDYRIRTDPVYAAYHLGDMETYRRLRASRDGEQRTE